MSVTAKNKKTAKSTSVSKSRQSGTVKKISHIVVSEEVGNYEKHPFFVKKANEMKELLKKVGVPKFDTKAK